MKKTLRTPEDVLEHCYGRPPRKVEPVKEVPKHQAVVEAPKVEPKVEESVVEPESVKAEEPVVLEPIVEPEPVKAEEPMKPVEVETKAEKSRGKSKK